MNELTVAELQTWKNQAKSFQLIDIREEEEIAVATIGGISIPMDQIISRKSELRQDIIDYRLHASHRRETPIFRC